MGAHSRRQHRAESSSRRSRPPRRRHRLAGRPSVAGLAVLGTVGGLSLLLRLDPATGVGLRAAGAAERPASGTNAAMLGSTSAGQGSGAVVLGQVATTDYGHVQVAITVAGHRIVAARAVRLPEDGGRTGERINARAMPILATQAVAAQSARIDGVSGATLSSTGYRQSLQSAIDTAHLA